MGVYDLSKSMFKMEEDNEVVIKERNVDDPICKERLFSALFGEFIGFLKSNGLTQEKEFEIRNEEVFQCSRKIIWVDELHPTKQISVYLNSIQMFVEFGVIIKETKEVLYRKKIENLRYKLSSGTQLELIDSHQDTFNELFEDFKKHFNELRDEIKQG